MSEVMGGEIPRASRGGSRGRDAGVGVSAWVVEECAVGTVGRQITLKGARTRCNE